MKIENVGPKINSKDLELIEMKLGAKLSFEYCDFLLRYNGGSPVPDTMDVPNAPGTPTDVQVFFGVGRSIESSNLSWNLSMIEERCPEHRILPIACDSGGNLFCLSVADGVAAEVVYCDLDSYDCALYPVVKTFDGFLAKLRPFGH